MTDIRKHIPIWASTRAGMSGLPTIAKIAVLDDESLMGVSQHAVAIDSLPPGFVRYLSDDEIIERELQFTLPEHAMRVDHKWNPGYSVDQQKSVPYYRQFDKRKF